MLLLDFIVVSFVDFEQVNATLYISKIKSGNGQGGHVLVVSALKLFPLKKIYVHMSKKKKNLMLYIYIFSYIFVLLILVLLSIPFIVIYSYLKLLLLYISELVFIINISIIIFFLKLFIHTCDYCFYMLASCTATTTVPPNYK